MRRGVCQRCFYNDGRGRVVAVCCFPRLYTSALDGFIASGRFTGKGDRELLTRVMDLRDRSLDFNQRLTMTEAQMGRDAAEIAQSRKRLRDSELFKLVRSRVRDLAKLLMSKYGISENEVFFTPLEKDVRSSG